ncbi:2TM domain-containing protein [Winogradskyella tangerina]|uniref:2TM domain-containing protein n=1 Tax=Winogradskyella tangerina TaxID=2023240 RepID=UPI000DBE3AD8|nr:2TM domain-containing protein [Winogradskyella tangerina]
MKSNYTEQEKYLKAQQILRRTRLFYLHLVGYIIVVLLILLNFYVLEDGPYKNTITALNLSILWAWTVVIIIHGVDVYRRRRSFFKRSWEDKKTEEYLKTQNKAEDNLWE